MNDLRTSLHRVADAVEPLPLDDDLWQRGVASRRRGQGLVVAAVLAIIASISWSAVLLRTDDREARTASTSPADGAIPSSIVDPGDLRRETDLDVGRASAAFVSAAGDPVVITADDGLYHALDLPGFVADQSALALSPDGLGLAWHQQGRASSRAKISVYFLAQGVQVTYSRPPVEDLRPRELSWSPDSTWVTWIADSNNGDTFIGRMRVSASSADMAGYLRVRGNVPDIAVSNDGTLVFSRAGGGLFVTDGTQEPRRISDTVVGGAGRFSPDGRLLALRSSPKTASYTLDTTTGEVLEHPFPEATFADAAVLPMGWLDDRVQLLLVQDGSPGHREMVVATPDVGASSTWRYSVGFVDAGPAMSVSLAVDLMPDLDGTSSQQLTHDFPTPDERDISWIIGLGVAAAIAVLMALRWLWRRLLG